MNLILLFRDDFQNNDRVSLVGRRAEHIARVIRPDLGDTVTVGLLGGLMGEGEVLSVSPQRVDLRVALSQPPPAPLPITLFMALPRPKSLFKSLQLAATMGIKDLHLYNASRVDKSFWKSGRLSQEEMRKHLILGLEQAKDTTLPTVTLHRLFAPLLNDTLPTLLKEDTLRFVAHPSPHAKPCPHQVQHPMALVLGPERGLTDHEVHCWKEAGFQEIHIGPRVLRVEQALPVVLAKLCDTV